MMRLFWVKSLGISGGSPSLGLFTCKNGRVALATAQQSGSRFCFVRGFTQLLREMMWLSDADSQSKQGQCSQVMFRHP